MDIRTIIENKKIALYGLSTETERVIKELGAQCEIVGLLDGFETTGEQFGYPIVDIKDIVKQDDIIIIVVARPGSCRTITKRIEDICRENNVELYDIRGKDLLNDIKVFYNFMHVKGYKKDDILNAIKEADIVSFDLFDTLLVRNILYSTDVIELTYISLKQQGIEIPDFVNRRIRAEKKLSQRGAPRLVKIYEEVLSDIERINCTASELAHIEYQIDCGLLHGRIDVIALMKEARNLHKQVYITTESYYSKNQIKTILQINGMRDFNEIIVSCEYNLKKTDGLFNKIAEIAGTTNILHIGDDIVSDAEAATRSGIKSFHIFSPIELLDLLGGLELEEHVLDISDKVKTGMFISKIFNSPFQFENDKRKIYVEDAFDIGFLFCAPVLCDFTFWFGEQVEKNQLSNIWFCARDGYLLKKMYELMYQEVDTTYFLISRISAIRAGVLEEKDIEYVDSMKFSGKTKENLWVRFGITADTIDVNDIDLEKDGLLRFSKKILKVAEEKRENYKRYIRGIHINEGAIAFFDFVAKGTSQMYIQKLVNNDILGFYFLQLEPEFMGNKGLKIKSFYTEAERETSVIFESYYILETLLTAPNPSVEEFDVQGNPIYVKETRSTKDIDCIMRAQKGILKYESIILSICPEKELKVNKELDEIFLNLLHYVEIKDKDFLTLVVEDPFFNRMTDITDIL